jgi:hypothetical protein
MNDLTRSTQLLAPGTRVSVNLPPLRGAKSRDPVITLWKEPYQVTWHINLYVTNLCPGDCATVIAVVPIDDKPTRANNRCWVMLLCDSGELGWFSHVFGDVEILVSAGEILESKGERHG